MVEKDLEITIDFKIEKDEDAFAVVHDFYQLFNDLINNLSKLSSYDIKMRGRHLDEWIENKDLPFRK
jgi:hypothetical protein